MRMRWGRTRKPREGVGVVNLQVYAGRVSLQAQAPIFSNVVVKGETLEDIHFDIEYDVFRREVAKALRQFASDIEKNSELIEIFECDG